MPLLLTKATLLLLSVYGWYALFSFGHRNGSLALVSAKRETGRLGSNQISYNPTFIGIPRVDQHLNVLLTFFWPLVDGSRPDASLHSFYFAGQGVAIWIATLIEGLRAGNQGHVVSFSTMFGLCFQAIGMAIIGPIFLVIHLTMSPTVSTPSAANLTVPPNELLALPFSVSTGFIIPTILMSLDAPTYLTHSQKAFFVRLWQIFPTLCYLSQHVWKRVLPVRMSSRPADIEHQLRLLNKVYFFGTTCASVTHVGTWMLSLTAYAFPSLFAPQMVPYLLPAQVFVPAMPWSNVKANSLATGVHWFLQWDELLTSFMYLLWACSLLIKTRQILGRTTGIVGEVLGLMGSALFVGPAGAALVAVQDRDGIVFGQASKDERERFASHAAAAATARKDKPVTAS